MPRAGQYHLRDIPSLLSTPIGRRKFRQLLWHGTWPAMRRAAGLYRRTLARHCRVVTIVGSFGKTTTSRAIACALGKDTTDHFGRNARNCVAMRLIGIRPDDQNAIIEVGIEKPGEMAQYAKMIQPDITVVTSIGSEHNRSLKTLETTRHEKSLMVRALPADGLAVLNGDDPNVMWMAEHASEKIITFGLGERNDIRATDVTLDWPHGTRFRLHVDGQTQDMRTKLMGHHMVLPILAAIAVATAEGVSLDLALKRLRDLSPTTGRMQPVALENNIYLLRDEFKSTLETINVALDTFAHIPAKRRVIVIGDISEPKGNQRALYHTLGKRMRTIASRVIVVGNAFKKYTSHVEDGGLTRETAFDAGTSVLKATEELKRSIEPGDVVLIKGRDTQRLDRIACALQGQNVQCNIKICKAKAFSCAECPMLEKAGRRELLT